MQSVSEGKSHPRAQGPLGKWNRPRGMGTYFWVKWFHRLMSRRNILAIWGRGEDFPKIGPLPNLLAFYDPFQNWHGVKGVLLVFRWRYYELKVNNCTILKATLVSAGSSLSSMSAGAPHQSVSTFVSCHFPSCLISRFGCLWQWFPAVDDASSGYLLCDSAPGFRFPLWVACPVYSLVGQDVFKTIQAGSL